MLGGVIVAALAGAALTVGDTDLVLTWMAAIPLTILILARAGGEGGPLARVVEHPARLLVATFFGLAAIGTALLALPAASETGSPIGLLEAAFTSVSAVCVTGLVVLDTPAAFSPVGEGLLLALIQVGGLGIMTFYTVAFAALGRRLSLRHERAVAGAMNVDDRRALVGSLRRVLVVTLVAEGAGAVLLFGAFLRHGQGVAAAAWSGLFTSVSAFCNAGFALRTSSLVEYQTDPLVLHTVGALVVAGGLSPAAIAAVPAWLRRRRVGLQEHLALSTTAVLLVGGALTFALFEWSVSLGHLSWMDRVHNAVFQVTALRTAGFNSLDLAASRPATQTLMITLMLIGGSPGGRPAGSRRPPSRSSCSWSAPRCAGARGRAPSGVSSRPPRSSRQERWSRSAWRPSWPRCWPCSSRRTSSSTLRRSRWPRPSAPWALRSAAPRSSTRSARSS
ncbi:MAG: hypothetical protein M5U28_41170 [Sandaracinaceae bacterium]|nr:hypothetical protein [Sandaracinaceae bacterium]